MSGRCEGWRWQLKNGQTRYAALISTLAPREVANLVGLPVDRLSDPHAVVLAYAKFYDQRGGAVETEFKQSKQGVGITRRNKKRFPARAVGDVLEYVGAQRTYMDATVVECGRAKAGKFWRPTTHA